MQFEENAILLSADSKPYDFDGRKGVSHQARFSINGEIFRAKANENLINQISPLIGKSGLLRAQFTSRLEKLAMELISFDA